MTFRARTVCRSGVFDGVRMPTLPRQTVRQASRVPRMLANLPRFCMPVTIQPGTVSSRKICDSSSMTRLSSHLQPQIEIHPRMWALTREAIDPGVDVWEVQPSLRPSKLMSVKSKSISVNDWVASVNDFEFDFYFEFEKTPAAPGRIADRGSELLTGGSKLAFEQVCHRRVPALQAGWFGSCFRM